MSETLTLKDAAALLDGCEYREEGSPEIWAKLKAAGIVAVFGASDDIAVINGAIDDECGLWLGGDVHLTRKGSAGDPDCTDCHETAIANALKIRAIWGRSGASWQYETEAPHEVFEVRETYGDDWTVYCRGIVFHLSAIPEDPADETARLRAENEALREAHAAALAEGNRALAEALATGDALRARVAELEPLPEAVARAALAIMGSK